VLQEPVLGGAWNQEVTRSKVKMARKPLLVCGILSSLLYVAMNVFIPMQWEGYSSASQTISELSAIGAPTRRLWVPLGTVYTLLVAAFGWGVLASSRRNRPLRVAGGLLVVYGVIGLAWPPMHLREVLAAGGGTLTDTMHIAFAMVTVLIMLLAIGFGAAAFGKRFRLYSIATMVILFAFGAFTIPDAPNIQANLPTPWVGVWERINIGVFLLWVVVLAIILLRARDTAAVTSRQAARVA
jgi:hypothetical protein